jgi:hypothetical protein
MLVVGDRKIMSRFAASRLLMIFWLGGNRADGCGGCGNADRECWLMWFGGMTREEPSYVSAIPADDPEMRSCPAPWGRAR